VNSTGNIESYHWTFGDGNNSSEKHPDHIYNQPDIFNVTLRITGKDGKNAQSTISIGIQRIDIISSESYGRRINVNPRVTYRFSMQEEIGPNIGKPTVLAECNIIDGLGEFEFSIEIWIWDSNENLIDVLFPYSETYSGRNANIQFQYDAQPDELDARIQRNRTDIYATLRLIQGTWNDASIDLAISYSME
jgi:PKD repeat protein